MKRFASILLIAILAGLNLQAQNTKVLIKTTMCDITVMLYDDTPLHKDNFITLVNKEFYDGILFHRVFPNFMIQTGDPGTKNVEPGQQPEQLGKIPAEIRINHFHKKGALAAARQDDLVNPKKESSGSQFYIVQGKPVTDGELNNFNSTRRSPFTELEIKTYKELGGYPSLDFNYTVFGEVTKGLDVVEAISKVKISPRGRPEKDVKIISARILK